MKTYKTKSLKRAQTRLNKLFEEFVINSVEKIDDEYVIEYFNATTFYKQTVEAQWNMEWYLDFLHTKLTD